VPTEFPATNEAKCEETWIINAGDFSNTPKEPQKDKLILGNNIKHLEGTR
jgi:hypothetical protein